MAEIYGFSIKNLKTFKGREGEGAQGNIRRTHLLLLMNCPNLRKGKQKKTLRKWRCNN